MNRPRVPRAGVHVRLWPLTTGSGVDVPPPGRLTKVEPGKKSVRLEASSKGKKVSFEAERVLLAAGRQPRTGDLGLDGTKIKVDKGFIEVDGFLRTGETGVYAIGDIVRSPLLAHMASHEGIAAVDHIAGKSVAERNHDQVPSRDETDQAQHKQHCRSQ